MRTLQRLHPRAKFERRSADVVHAQRAALEKDIHEPRLKAARLEMQERVFDVLLVTRTKANAFAFRSIFTRAQRQRMMRALLHAAKMNRRCGLVGNLQSDHLGVKVARL